MQTKFSSRGSLCLMMAALSLVLLMQGCKERPAEQAATGSTATASGDSTLYGLVCDGSNDSIVIYLPDPYDGSDPDTLDILDASLQQHVFGRLRIGDRVAIMRNWEDSTKADAVIVTQDLLGQWCYKVKPFLRRRAEMVGQSDGQVISQLPDTIQELFEMEREYGFTLKADSVVMPVGLRRTNLSAEEDSYVQYPPLKFYRRWYISNGRLLLVEMRLDSAGNSVPVATDTAELVRLTPDTLCLRFGDEERGYYRKTETVE